MNRLVENELIYGRLLPVAEPHLVARYNKALRAFGLPETKLAEFRIDMTGFSPEIAEELGDVADVGRLEDRDRPRDVQPGQVQPAHEGELAT